MYEETIQMITDYADKNTQPRVHGFVAGIIDGLFIAGEHEVALKVGEFCELHLVNDGKIHPVTDDILSEGAYYL